MSPYGRARSPAVRATLDYLRGFYLARLRLVKNKEAEGCEHMHSGDEPVGLCDTGLPTRFLLSATALSKNKEAKGCKGVREGGEPCR